MLCSCRVKGCENWQGDCGWRRLILWSALRVFVIGGLRMHCLLRTVCLDRLSCLLLMACRFSISRLFDRVSVFNMSRLSGKAGIFGKAAILPSRLRLRLRSLSRLGDSSWASSRSGIRLTVIRFVHCVVVVAEVFIVVPFIASIEVGRRDFRWPNARRYGKRCWHRSRSLIPMGKRVSTCLKPQKGFTHRYALRIQELLLHDCLPSTR